MKKTLLDEMILELLKLQAEDNQKMREAVENGERIPGPASPKVVFSTINRVAAEHQVTSEELAALLSLRGGEITAVDIQTAKELKELEQN